MKRGSVKPTGFWGRFGWRRFAYVWTLCALITTVIIGIAAVLDVYANALPAWQTWLYLIGGMTVGEFIAEAARTWRGE